MKQLTNGQDREEEANDYRERIAAVKNVLLEHDKEKNSARRDHFLGFDWRCPNEALRKVRVRKLWFFIYSGSPFASTVLISISVSVGAMFP